MRDVVVTAVLASVLTAPALAAETQVTLPGGIDGTLSLPDNAAGAAPVVLMLHGFGSSKDEVGGMYAREAAALAERGIASLRISFRGFGKSDGDTGATTIDAQLEDVLAAVEFLRTQEGINSDRLGLLGFSLGGGVAVLAAADRPEWFDAVATWSSVGDFDTDLKVSLGPDAFDRARAEGIVGLDLGWRTIALKAEFFDSLEDHSIADALGAIQAPVFAVAGSEDFSAQYTDHLAAAGGEGSEAWTIPGADHIFGVLAEDPTTADEVIARTAEWLSRTL
jgi:hypothetical protein